MNADPCDEGKMITGRLTLFASSEMFKQACKELLLAGEDNHEHGIVFGRDSTGQFIRTEMKGGSKRNALVLSLPVRGAFADIHNHPGNSVPSAGDIYNLILLNIQKPAFGSRITVLANGAVYAVAVVDPDRASAFLRAYPPEQTEGFSPRFPGELFNEFAELKSYLLNIEDINRTLADEMATSFMLDKYQTGIVLLLLDDQNQFHRIIVDTSTAADGSKRYYRRSCSSIVN